MTHDDDHIYAFDRHLDDTRPWESGIYDCPDCGFTFHYTRRVDRPLACPRCTPSDRWTRLSVWSDN